MTVTSALKKNERQSLINENRKSNCIGRSLRHNDGKISRLFFPREKIYEIDFIQFSLNSKTQYNDYVAMI
jgi:hypothetical protein